MKLGIMQPYYFPYIGYWQLMNAVDNYIVYDDVNFIKGGWINRNRLLCNGQPMFFNLKMQNASPNLLINEIGVAQDEVYKLKQLKTLEML
ncbi:MAG: WbqC family protein, partial [Clostridia bacterium]